jgi:FkbM family methyltransferase
MNAHVKPSVPFSVNSQPSKYQQETEAALVAALARHVRQRSFIDVGAEKGSFARPLLEAGFAGTLFEPFPTHLPGLEELSAGHACRVFPFAIDESDHEGQLHVAVDAEGKTMDYFHSLHHDESNPHAQHKSTLSVPCRSLESLAREGLIDSSYGIIKIDTEGNDLKVLKGMGHVRAEVLVCEFVTPDLYPTWRHSFPEKLLQAAQELGYEECIAVKRFGSHEMITFGPQSFVEGEWGNLIFTNSALFTQAREALQQIAGKSESNLVAACTQNQRDLEAKETVIQNLDHHIKSQTLQDEAQQAELAQLRRTIEFLQGGE